MRADYRIFLDACVLANFGVCDLLLRLSERPRLIVPHWAAEVMTEVRRTQIDKLGWPPELADSFQAKARESFPDADVIGYETLLPLLGNDPKDRHVLAAAIRGNCPLILTFNLKHFPAEAIKPWNEREGGRRHRRHREHLGQLGPALSTVAADAIRCSLRSKTSGTAPARLCSRMSPAPELGLRPIHLTRG